MLTLPGLGFANKMPLWLTVVVISRDVAIVLTVTLINLAVARRTFTPSLLGKTATATYILAGVVALFENYRGVASTVLPWLVYLTLAITLASGLQYVYMVTRWLASGDSGNRPRS
jgi:phosphatidylglycerophosphate synthase